MLQIEKNQLLAIITNILLGDKIIGGPLNMAQAIVDGIEAETLTLDYPGETIPLPQKNAADELTLLDYQAGQALAGIVANPSSDQASADKIAEGAYHLAAAMLEERKKYLPNE